MTYPALVGHRLWRSVLSVRKYTPSQVMSDCYFMACIHTHTLVQLANNLGLFWRFKSWGSVKCQRPISLRNYKCNDNEIWQECSSIYTGLIANKKISQKSHVTWLWRHCFEKLKTYSYFCQKFVFRKYSL